MADLPTSYTSNQVVQAHLQMHLGELEKELAADCFAYVGSIDFGVDDAIREAIDNIKDRKRRLVFILETFGGYAETARRISDTVRHHYPVVDFLIPGHAMSAGTILVMSGDAIHMDYYSVLGPIDPQVMGDDGTPVPALGYLIQYQKLLDKANKGKASTAEIDMLLGFDQMRLYAYEQARDLSHSLLEEWLVKYKFKDWHETETNKRKVTDQMKRKRAKEIADKLSDVRMWNSHGIGISMERLRRDLKLKVDDFGADPKLSGAVRRYHKLLTDFMVRVGHRGVIHTRNGYRQIS